MSRFVFDLASASDDAELRSLLAATPMPGTIKVSLRREPSYFAAAVVEGEFHQTLVARDTLHRRITSCGSRSVRLRLVNGGPMPIGYLGGLRVLPQYRGGTLLARGYRFLRRLHEDGRAALYLTTIAEGNRAALQTLMGGRAGLPQYHDAGRYHTVALPVLDSTAGRSAKRKSRPKPGPQHDGGLEIRSAAAADLPRMLEWLGTAGRRRQFFPCYSASDLGDQPLTFQEMRPSDWSLALRRDRLVGMLGCWDQRGWRQSVVERYSPALALARPWYNLWALAGGRPRLPAAGSVLPAVIAAIPLVENDDGALFQALLESVMARAATMQAEYLLVGMHERDPLLPVLRQYRGRSYLTRLFLVCWDDGERLRQQLDDRPPYLELGCL